MWARKRVLLTVIFLINLSIPMMTMAENFQFDNQTYLFRWTDGQLYELTPEGQSDLNNWEEMVSFSIFQSVDNGEALAEIANQTLANYQSVKGMLLATDSRPATDSQPAEHFVAYLFIQPDTFEFAANRMLLLKDYGVSVVYSKRFYNQNGEDGPFVSDWLETNGARLQRALMAIPKRDIESVTHALLDQNTEAE